MSFFRAHSVSVLFMGFVSRLPIFVFEISCYISLLIMSVIASLLQENDSEKKGKMLVF